MFKIFKKKKVAPVVQGIVPKHLAFICDGNRRWAKDRGLPPLEGHRSGITNFENFADWFMAHGVETLTFFIFSTENWDRSKDEVDFLMKLFYSELKKNLKNATAKNIRYRVIGSRDRLPAKLAAMCDKLEADSAENTGGTVVFALNYGGRDEIVRAVNTAIDSGATDLTIETFESMMDTGDLTDIDMMVRTSGEHRISNFLLWKLAYAELLFIPQHWPQLVRSEKLWHEILSEFARRNRRFGGGAEENYSGQ